jgi:hypothetical protein
MIHTRCIASGFMTAEAFHSTWPFSLKALASLYNVAVPPMAMGMTLFVVAGLCLLYAMARWRYMNIIGLVFFWSAPQILFWCLYNNIARHLTVACYPIALLVAVVIIGECRKVRVWGPVIAAILAVNYFACPAFALPHMIRPSSRLLKARDAIQQRIDGWHRAGRFFADLPDSPKVLYGDGNIIYAMWEMMAKAESFRRIEKGEWSFADNGRQQRAKFIYVPVNQPLPETEPGWNAYLWTDNGQRSRIDRVPAATAP